MGILNVDSDFVSDLVGFIRIRTATGLNVSLSEISEKFWNLVSKKFMTGKSEFYKNTSGVEQLIACLEDLVSYHDKLLSGRVLGFAEKNLEFEKKKVICGCLEIVSNFTEIVCKTAEDTKFGSQIEFKYACLYCYFCRQPVVG